MPAPSGEAVPGLRRALGLRDLVLLNIACIVSYSSLGQVAQFGFGSLTLFALAVVFFLVPSGIVVAELNARMPEEGGFYLWTREAFGDFHGYVAAWTYWASTIVWLPTVVLLVAAAALYAGGESWLSLVEDPLYNAAVCLAVIWGATLLNVVGLERAKWIQNVGATAVWVTTALLFLLAIVFVARFGSVHPFAVERLIPDFGDFGTLPFFAIVAFSLTGLELAPVMAGEIRDPRRTIPRALVISAVAVALIYMAGTLALVFTIEPGGIGIIDAMAQAFREVGQTMGIPWIGPLGALLVALGTMGLFGSWLTGVARIPFVIGLDRYLPRAVAKIHPRWGSPWVALLMQGVVLTLLFLASIAGATVKEAFLVLLDMSILLYFLPYLYLFASLIWHLRNDTGRRGMFPWLRRRGLGWWVAVPGFLVTLVSMILAAVPSGEVENGPLFVLKVVGGAVLLTGCGIAVYGLRRGRRGAGPTGDRSSFSGRR